MVRQFCGVFCCSVGDHRLGDIRTILWFFTGMADNYKYYHVHIHVFDGLPDSEQPKS